MQILMDQTPQQASYLKGMTFGPRTPANASKIRSRRSVLKSGRTGGVPRAHCSLRGTLTGEIGEFRETLHREIRSSGRHFTGDQEFRETVFSPDLPDLPVKPPPEVPWHSALQ
jgi:hypothetical protein